MNISTEIRKPAVAGSFYPDDSSILDSAIQTYLADCDLKVANKQPVAMIVPHAGYVYSAPTAACAYKQLIPFADKITRVIILGPSHRIPLMGIAVSSADTFQTPLGLVPLDKKAIAQLNQLTFVQTNDEAHYYEHSLEVQLPFLQKILTHFTLVPLVVGLSNEQQVSELLDYFWQDHNTLILISSDLSHYLAYDQAKLCDQATCRAIEALEAQNIQYEQACGHSAVAGMLLNAKKNKLQVKTLDLRNSGDTAGTRDRVVGYGAWAFFRHN